jgi:hypothetical protein
MAMMLLGAIMIIETAHHQLVKAAGDGPAMHFFGLSLNSNSPLTWAVAVGLFALGIFGLRLVWPRISDAWGAALAMRQGGGVIMTAALSLKDVHKSFGTAQIIRGVTLDIRPGERHAIIGPERRRQVDAVPSHQRPLRADARRDRAQRPAHRRAAAVRDRAQGAVAQLPGDEYLPATERL